MFDPSEIASLMIPVELKGFVPPKICWDTKTLQVAKMIRGFGKNRITQDLDLWLAILEGKKINLTAPETAIHVLFII